MIFSTRTGGQIMHRQIFVLDLRAAGFKRAGAIALALSLVSCSTTWPVVVIGKKGEMLKGTATASLQGGSFSVTDGKLTCGGGYNSLNTSSTITMPVLCSDGRRG